MRGDYSVSSVQVVVWIMELRAVPRILMNPRNSLSITMPLRRVIQLER
jgi:hypothetical protein